jgi:UDP-3-O-[3-hydroxymyristoyl] glucosamine N-acyltransferase
MKDILFEDIINFLQDHQVEFQLLGKAVKKSYKAASIFAPIESGFYFLVEPNQSSTLNKSLLLVNAEPEVVSTKNCFILVDETTNVQALYYSILADIFKRDQKEKYSPTAIIHKNARMGKNVQIGHYSIIEQNCVIGDHVIVGDHVKIHSNAVVGSNTQIDDGSVIGTRGMSWVWDDRSQERIIQPQLGGVKIERDCILGAGTIVVRGSLSENTIIKAGTLLAPGCRLGHGTVLGKRVHLANNVTTGGNTYIGDESFIGSGAVFRPKVKLHPMTIVGAGSVVVKDTTELGKTLIGVPAREKTSNKAPSGMPKPKQHL